jgi:predicted TIM-barrel fold metal-dependent hydrolase
MDAGRVSKSLISAWYAPRNVMISNDEVAEFVAQGAGRLVGVGSVDISKPMQAVREIRRCVEELGFKAIRVLPWLWGVPPTDPLFYPVYVGCSELEIPFCTQIGHTGPLMPSEVGRPIDLDRVALDFPELKIALPAGAGRIHARSWARQGDVRFELSHDRPGQGARGPRHPSVLLR